MLINLRCYLSVLVCYALNTRQVLTVFMLLTGFLFSYGQKVKEEHLAAAEELKEMFEDSEVALLTNESTYYFRFDEKKQQTKVFSKERKEYLGLQFNSSFVERNYFHQNLKISSYSLKNYRGKTIPHDEFCGHYTRNGIFHSDAEVCAYHFSFPSKGGYRVFETSKTFLDPKYLTTLYFHSNVPAASRKMVFRIPEWMDVELLEMNFEGYDINKKLDVVDKETVVTFTIENIEAFPDESNLPGISHFLPHVIVLTKGYEHDGIYTDVLSNTNSLYQWYKSLVDQTSSNPLVIQPKVEELVKGLTSDEQKMKAIYYWVQENIKYIAFEEGLAAFKPEDAHRVLENKYGDCKGMANLTKDMLKMAGLDARLSWIGTNQLAYTYDIPSLAVDNHMICSVNLDGRYIHLDATEKNHPFDEYAERLQGKQVLIENGDSYLVKEIPETPIDRYLHKTNVTFSLGDGTLQAEAIETLNGELKKGFIDAYQSITPDRKRLFFKSIASGDLKTEAIALTNQPELTKENPLTLEYTLAMNDQLNSFGEETYVTLDYKKELANYQVPSDRKHPLNFAYKMNHQFNGTLPVPSHMEIIHLPDPVAIASEHFEFTLKYELENNAIRYQRELKVLDTYLPVEKFSEWNAALDLVQEFYDDQLILRTSK